MNDNQQDHNPEQQPRNAQAANGCRAANRSASVASGSPIASQGHAEPARAAPPAALGMADLWLVVRRWGWKCAAAGLALAVAACAVVWLTFTPKYEASAWLEISSRPFVLAFEPRQESNVFLETQLQTIKSPVVLSKVSGDLKIADLHRGDGFDSPLEWLQKGLKVGFLGRSELCEVKFTSRDPATAAGTANAVAKAYLSLHTDSHGEMSAKIVKLLKEEKESREGEVRVVRERVRTLTKAATENDPTLLHQDEKRVVVPTNPMAASEDRKMAAQVERAVAEARLKAYRDSLDAEEIDVSEGELSMALQGHPEITSLKGQLAGIRTKMRQHQQRSSRGAADPEAAKLARQARGLEEALAKATDEVRPLLVDEIRGLVRAERQQAIDELVRKIDDQKLLEQLWDERIAEQRKKYDKLGDKTVDLQFAKNELTNSEGVLEKLTERITAFQTEMGAPPRAWSRLEASRPPKAIEAIPFKRFGAAGLAAFGLPFGLAFLWERWVRRIHDAGQLALAANVPVLGEVTLLPARYTEADRGEDRFLRDRITFEESIEALRVALMLSPDMHGLQTLVVASAISREGKTSLASSLAMSVARSVGEPTLLVDADVRCPNLHEIFGVAMAPGLTEILTGQCPLNDAIVHTDGSPLDILPAGRLRSTPHAMFQREEIVDLLAELRLKYRYVLIDSPPVLAASETLVLASAADGTLLCTMRDVSRGPQLRMACDRLGAVGARLVGTVISGIPTRYWAYKYGGYSYGWKKYARLPEPADSEEAAE